jgi:hypothetical protein
MKTPYTPGYLAFSVSESLNEAQNQEVVRLFLSVCPVEPAVSLSVLKGSELQVFPHLGLALLRVEGLANTLVYSAPYLSHQELIRLKEDMKVYTLEDGSFDTLAIDGLY